MPLCAICGKDEPIVTDDHIPPKLLFGEKPDYQLITVPACLLCNGGTSMDDEYFALLATDHKISEDVIPKQVVSKTIRALNKPKKRKYARRIRHSMEPIELYSKSGLFIHRTAQINLDLRRLLRVVEKTIRGLYYKISNKPVPVDYTIWCNHVDTLYGNLPPNLRAVMRNEMIPSLMTCPIATVGPDVFAYRYRKIEGDDRSMLLLLYFYGIHRFIGAVRKKE
jgi:hypothetical protein